MTSVQPHGPAAAFVPPSAGRPGLDTTSAGRLAKDESVAGELGADATGAGGHKPACGDGPSLSALHRAVEAAEGYLREVATRPVAPQASYQQLRRALDLPLPDGPAEAVDVVDALVAAAGPGLTTIASPRFFGYVIGGALPAALAADVLAVVWDQNAGLASLAPAAAAAESVAGSWILDLLGLPATASVGLTTGTQMAHVTALAAARHRVLADAGWDVEADGLTGAPPVRVFVGAARHTTVDAALRLLGFGTRRVTVVGTDRVGRMDAGALRMALAAGDGPAIVVTQTGEINTGALDSLPEVIAASKDHGAWVHVDGAFGLWARVSASPRRRALAAGVEAADSWATDGHKWLNVPYDSGIAIVADSEAHRASMSSTRAAYVAHGNGDERDPVDWTPEFSRRARGFALYAALRSLGRAGLADLVDRCCDHAARFAVRLRALPGFEILNDPVELNQVLVRIDGDDATTQATTTGVLADGTAYMTGTVWNGLAAMRISVCNWATTADDVDAAVYAVAAAATAARRARRPARMS